MSEKYLCPDCGKCPKDTKPVHPDEDCETWVCPEHGEFWLEEFALLPNESGGYYLKMFFAKGHSEYCKI